jgi:menaquinone C8-methyltransferase
MIRLVSAAAGMITRAEGNKFLKLDDPVDDAFIKFSELRKGGEISLYVHIPFCKKLCPFCCFNRYLFREDKARAYFKQLRKELDLYIGRGFSFSHIYFGGGTPTILMDELIGFIGYIKSKFPVREISLETTPNEINPEMIQSLKQAGINRLSIGIQSFNDEICKAMGRMLLTGEEAKQRLTMLKGQFNTVNIDLIFNFPDQTVEQFKSDVEIFKNLGINQVTFYPLMPSPHKKTAMEKRFNRVNTNTEKKFYDIILKSIYEGGYRASTAWCFSRNDAMIDEYIVDYSDYIGIGSGSVSLVRGNFYVNAFSLERYGSLIESGKFPIVKRRMLTQKEYLRYYLLTKLFGLSVNKKQFRDNVGADIDKALWSEMLMLKLGGVVKDGETITVTRRGLYPVSVMMREFFTALNTLREYCIENQI